MIDKIRKNLSYSTFIVVSLVLTSCSSGGSSSNDAGSETAIPAVTSGATSGSSVLGTNGNTYGNDGFEIEDTETVYAYKESSPYAAVLRDCVVINTRAESCPLTTLPFIGDGTTQPTIDDVMDRVLVTHNWMGDRFEQVLMSAPPEVMTLFSSATAVLIGSNVRPSYYTTLTGAIQIDPVYLWSSVEEKGSISKAEDFRSDFGSDLQFWFLSRTANRSGDRLTPFYSLDDDSERPFEDITVPLVRLLVHELAHATDFMPRSKIAGLDTSLSAFDSIDSVFDDWLSPQLTAAFPLTSLEMVGFANVRYRGAEATNVQKTTTAADVGEFMASDGAIQFYSYSTIREDLAQLVESVVMSYRYDSISNSGFTQKPFDESNYTCADLRVAWGQRNRLADPLVNVRAREATDLVISLTPQMTEFLDNSLGSVESMQNNVGWCDNQTPANGGVVADTLARSAFFTGTSTPEAGPLFREMIEADRIVHPEGVYHD